jgi:CheY-like chemotaxis protein
MKILYVEDDQLLQEIMPEILKSIGYPNDTVNNGLEALKALEKYDYDIVLMDLQMPIMGGLETAMIISAITSQKKKPNIIIMSGGVIEKYQLSEFCINDFIQKPFSIFDLRTILLKWENRNEKLLLKV